MVRLPTPCVRLVRTLQHGEVLCGQNGLRRGDFEKIVHLMDTDGTFVEDSAIVGNVDTDRPQYFDDVIRCRNAEVIIQRNAQKSKVMRRLAALPTVWGSIPYEPFCMS